MKRVKGSIPCLILWLCVMLTGCGQREQAEAVTEKEVRFTDSLGHEAVVTKAEHVAVLTGSYARIWQLAGGELAAVTKDAYEEQELILPEDVIQLGSGDMTAPDMEVLLSSDIDLVLLSSKIPEHVKMQRLLDKTEIPYAYFEVETFEDYLHMLKICTDITGESEKYEENGLHIRDRIESVIAGVPEEEKGKTVLLIRAYSAGAKVKNSDNMTGMMLKELGCINIADTEESLLEDLSMEQIITEDPEYIFVTTMGSQEKALAYLEDTFLSQPAWNSLQAVKNGNYYVLPKELFHTKPNDRWNESYEMLAEMLYGD